jgi:hypothetical protein
MTTNINLLQLSEGDVLTDQFFNDTGLTFTIPTCKVISDTKSPFGLAAVAARDGGAVEFPLWSIKGKFSNRHHSRIGFLVNNVVTIKAYDEHGTLIGSALTRSPKFETDGSYFYGEFATGKANIGSFDISYTSDHPFAIAGMTFDTAGAFQKPDFRFYVSDFDIPTAPGQHGSIELTIARLYGSHGAINLAISSAPSGLFAASPAPPPLTVGDGTKVLIALVAGATPIKWDETVTITGNPVVTTAGTGRRAVSVYYTSFG